MARAAADQSVFHAIADPTRRRIMDALSAGEQPVGELMEKVNTSPARSGLRGKRSARMGQSAFSQHLAVLRRSGLVRARRSGRQQMYSINVAPLKEVVDWVAVYERFWTSKLDKLGEYLEQQEQGP